MTSNPANLPPPLMTSEPGSFAESTIVIRKPAIIDEVLRDNPYPEEIRAELLRFKDEIAHGSIGPLTEDAPDAADWEAQWRPRAGRRWLDVDWYFAESFFYRRLLEAVRYFQPSPWQGVDPFAQQKRAQDGDALALAAQALAVAPAGPVAAARALLYACLWGNRVDLSNHEVLDREAPHTGQAHDVLLDDSAALAAWLGQGGHARIDFVNDNTGVEATFDLLLADHLLAHGWAAEVRLNLKPHPLFVSDAMISDIAAALEHMARSSDPRLQTIGARMLRWRQEGRLALTTHPFWCSAYAFFEMPEGLRRELSASDLVIVKGDANYRRLLGDRHWPFTARLQDITSYFPAPFVTLRTVKSELMVGLQPGQAEALTREDAAWLINGKRGLIQWVTRRA